MNPTNLQAGTETKMEVPLTSIESRKRSKYRMLDTDIKRKAVLLALKEGPRYSSAYY